MSLLVSAKNVIDSWEGGDLAAAVRALSHSIGKMPETPTEWMKFDAFEMNGCIMWHEDDQQNFERCDDDDPELSVWSLYGHVTGEGVRHIADFPKEDRAICEFLCDLLNALYKK